MGSKKKYIIIMYISIIVITFSSLFVFLSIIDDANNFGYPNGGRDTYAQFGNRRFVILSGNGTLTLCDRSTVENYSNCRYKNDDHVIETNVYGYKEVENYVYTIGLYGYTKLNFVNGKYQQFNSLNYFSIEDKNAFGSIILIER